MMIFRWICGMSHICCLCRPMHQLRVREVFNNGTGWTEVFKGFLPVKFPSLARQGQADACRRNASIFTGESSRPISPTFYVFGVVLPSLSFPATQDGLTSDQSHKSLQSLLSLPGLELPMTGFDARAGHMLRFCNSSCFSVCFFDFDRKSLMCPVVFGFCHLANLSQIALIIN